MSKSKTLTEDVVSMKALESIEELKKRFPDEWLLLADCEVDAFDEPIRGFLLKHSKKRSGISKFIKESREAKKFFETCLIFSGDIDDEEDLTLYGG